MYASGYSVDLSKDMTDAQILRATAKEIGGSSAGMMVEADEEIGRGDIWISRKKDGKPQVLLRPR
jgi:hypothetical protein